MQDIEIISKKDAIAIGQSWYFTGKPCKYGHVDKRLIKGDCMQCNRDRNAVYRAIPENAEKARSVVKSWREKVGKDVSKAKTDEWKIKKFGSTAAYWADYNARIREKRRLAAIQYSKDNPEIIKNNSRNRKARKKRAEGRHTAKDISSILDAQNMTCVYCSADLSNGYHVDHIMPIALGGSNWPSNLQCLCPSCNMSKGAKHPDDWHKEIGYGKLKGQ